ncbi:MAG: FkbM family methyltransferase [Alphaproteobacteria bacterium]|nr:FkbM family methyltransferase [Alphaproteobacteria bacterium]
MGFTKGKRPEHGEFGRISYAQEAEDLLLFNVYKRQREGFYVDVGAHHPTRFSNTQIFYDYGWYGINIDAHPDSLALFQRDRPRDINLQLAISDVSEPLTFYMFDETSVSSFDEELSKGPRRAQYSILGTTTITPRRLDDILSEFLPDGQSIDFLNVDVEGHDLNVLRSNDWVRFRPTFVLVESLERRAAAVNDDPHCQLMTKHGYHLYCQTPRTLFFRDSAA